MDSSFNAAQVLTQLSAPSNQLSWDGALPRVLETSTAGHPTKDCTTQNPAIEFPNSYGDLQYEELPVSYGDTQSEEFPNSYGDMQYEEFPNSYGDMQHEEFQSPYEELPNSYGDMHYEGSRAQQHDLNTNFNLNYNANLAMPQNPYNNRTTKAMMIFPELQPS